MAILNVYKAQKLAFLKRSVRPGFAGIDNNLLYKPKTIVLFGDGTASVTGLVAAVKTA